MPPKAMSGASEPAVRNVALPQHAASYTVIPNGLAIDESRRQLASYGFKIAKEEYMLAGRDETGAHQIAMGRYICEMPGAPMEFKMVLLWVNSYDKSTRFKVAIGVHLEDAGVDIIKGEGSSFRRKHTGKADEEVVASLDEKLQMHAQLFQEIMDDKVLMEQVEMGSDRQSFFLGKGFLEWKLLSGEQMHSVRRFIEKPVYQPECSNAWCFYVRTLMACAKEHPRTYVETFRALHAKIMYYVTAGFPNLSDVKIDVPLMDKVHSNVPASVVEEQLKLNAEEEVKAPPIEVLPNQISLFEEVKPEVKQEVRYDLGDDGPVEIKTIVPVEPPKELPVVEVKAEPKIVSETFSIASALFQNDYDVAFKSEIMAAYGEVHGFGEVEETLFREFLAKDANVQQYKKKPKEVVPAEETPAERSTRLLDAIEESRKPANGSDFDVDEVYHKAQEKYGNLLGALADKDKTLLDAIERGDVEEVVVEDKAQVEVVEAAVVVPQTEWEKVDTSKGMAGQPTIYDYKIIDHELYRKLKRPALIVDEDLDNPDFFATPAPGKIVSIELPTAEIPSVDVPIIPVVKPESPNISPFL